ncbi:MAG: hypothetical protein WCE87_00520, partial [Candidatus Udaeobacter sp.]
PIFATSSVSKASDSTVNGGAALLKEWMRRTCLGSAAGALLVKNNGISAALAMGRSNCARRVFRLPHVPVAALVGGDPDIERVAVHP